MKLIEKIAVFFSVAFQPLFMPFVGVLLMFLLNPVVNNTVPTESKQIAIWFTFVYTVLLPLFMFIVLYKIGWVSDVNLTVRKERIIPTFISVLLFIGLYFQIKGLEGMNILLAKVFLGSVFGLLLANIITIYWKISIHSFGVFGVSGCIVALSIFTKQPFPSALIITLLIGFIVGISRLILKRHTPLQVLLGGLLGFLSPIVFLYFLA